MVSNRKLGNDFEKDLCKLLSEHGFWVHNFAQSRDGQPADIIAVRHGVAYLIDCKVCTNTLKGFDLSRMEENQDLSMDLWETCGNGKGWFAIKLHDSIYMIPHSTIRSLRAVKSHMSPSEIFMQGEAVGRWLKRYK